LGPLVNVSFGQSTQVRSSLAEGVFVTRLPALQSDHTSQASALRSALKVPLSQPVHSPKAPWAPWVPAGQ
jgi:hypothetical protein